MDIKCFLIEKTNDTFRFLRRYASGSECPAEGYSWHDAEIPIEDGIGDADQTRGGADDILLIKELKDQFPEKCKCGYEFKETDIWQIFRERKYRDERGNFYTLNNAQVGAIWRATWYEDMPSMCGLDGKAYMVKTPGGDWHIDGQASNCTKPEDNVHKCWCRHGEAPNFTVDKNGNTCNAGGGSILKGNYHGFLRNGYLINC